ncbi:hypothetical protein VB779_22195 [Haloarculaceae archaeon H-GB11]|nr:hypothetical protein [Haloarculaceae archaeon H-GB11]
MVRLPGIIDLRDDLASAQQASDNDVDEEIADVLAKLDRLSRPDGADSMGVLDDVENTLLRLQERETDADAGRRFEAARNRIQIFRDATVDSDDDLVVIESRVTERDTDSEVRITDVDEEPVTVHATLANVGDATEGVVEAVFYGADGDVLHTASAPIELHAGDEGTVTLSTTAPVDADYSAVVTRTPPTEQ